MFPIASNSDDNEKLYVDDVFSTNLLSDTSVQANNNINFIKYGGMVWAKNRDNAWPPTMYDTNRGGDWAYLRTDRTDGDGTVAAGTGVTFNSNGFTFGGNIDSVWLGKAVAWSFRKAAKFFDIVTYTGNSVSGRQIPHSLGITPGMIIVKCTSNSNFGTTDDPRLAHWWVYHRGLANNGSNFELLLNKTTAQQNNGGLNADSSTFTVYGTSLESSYSQNNVTGYTYIAYLFAHDPSADGIIQCGSFTTDAGGSATVNLGWEPQFLLTKSASSVNNWLIADSMRGMPQPTQTASVLFPNSTNTEASVTYQTPTATGFNIGGFPTSATCIYMAIRRPNKPPTSATQVFAPVAIIGGVTDKVAVTSSVNAPDTAFSFARGAPYSLGAQVRDRLCSNGKSYIQLEGTGTEVSYSAYTNGFSNLQNGIDGANAGSTFNYSSPGTIYWMFKRAPGFFDVVCYTGTGSATTFAHNLGVPPEMMIVKRRTVSGADWTIYHSTMGATKYTYLDGSTELTGSTYWNNTPPTSTVFTVGTDYHVNYAAPNTYVAFLFATLAGISKVGGYTGNGSSQNIDCGFASGARFILIHRIDSGSNNWYCWDTARGIVTGNDGRISLNSATAEVTTDDSVDPYSPGFTVNQVAATNINVTSATYIYLAVA